MQVPSTAARTWAKIPASLSISLWPTPETRPWVVSYDDVPEIRELYDGETNLAYGIAYAAQVRYRGQEIAFFSESLDPPAVANPIRITREESKAIRASLAS